MAAGRTDLLVAGASAFVALTADTAFAQCAMCRRALESPEGQHMIAAFRSGILVLLAAPFAVFATVAVLAVRRVARRTAAAPETNEQPVHRG